MEFAPVGLRSPEEILYSNFGNKMDIWAIGCLVGVIKCVSRGSSRQLFQTFEFITGRWLFYPEEGETWTLDDDHLAKILELTGERFDDTMLEFSVRKDEFFDEDCTCSFHSCATSSRVHRVTTIHTITIAV